jgi:hypothetical protein
VSPLVTVHGSGMGKSSSANSARKRLLIGVGAEMLEELRSMRELPLTDSARVWTFTSMQSLVLKKST